MALQFNSFSRAGLISVLRAANSGDAEIFHSSSSFRIFPSTVPFPANPINTTGGVPGGHILAYSGLTYSLVGNSILITGGNNTAIASAGGTLSWWAIVGSGVLPWIGAVISNSLTLSGGGGIVTVNTLTPTGGQNVSIAFNLTMVV